MFSEIIDGDDDDDQRPIFIDRWLCICKCSNRLFITVTNCTSKPTYSIF